MEQILSTTPFGGRSLTPAMMQAEASIKRTSGDIVAHKWRLWRSIAEAKNRIGVSDRALAVLNALLSFHPETTLTGGEPIIVFPSNEELSLRAHGMAPATLRRQLAALVDLGLIIRRDSPNGKRYARKGRDGHIEQAFGFDLAILVARSAEFEQLAEAVRRDRAHRSALRERISILRRDISKWIAAAAEQGQAGVQQAAEELAALSTPLHRQADAPALEGRAGALVALLKDVQNNLTFNAVLEKESANESQIDRHLIQNSNTDPSESEKASGKEEIGAEPYIGAGRPEQGLPLGLVLKACPEVVHYTKSGISNWAEFVSAAALARSALGISPDAWKAASEVLGAGSASILVAAILEKGDRVKSPGGYLRALTAKAKQGSFSTGPIVFALLNERAKTRGSPGLGNAPVASWEGRAT